MHPRLRSHYLGLKIAYIGAAVFFIIASAAPLWFLFDEFKDNLSFYFLYLVLPLFAAVLAAVWYIRFRVEPNIKRMAAVLTTAVPQSMFLTALGIDRRFRERAALRRHDRPSDEPPWCIVRIKTPNDGLHFKKNTTLSVTVYQDAGANDGFIVVDTGKQLIWGLASQGSH